MPMSGFSAAWLALREPYDAQARNPAIRAEAVAPLSGQPAVTVVDLACGAGSTARSIAPLLATSQHWRLVDNDLSLLARAERGLTSPHVRVTCLPIDLSLDLETALDAPVDLVTTSALFDLVSAEWLERLATELAVRNLPIYAALTYDGRIAFDPPHPLDRDIIAAINAHQRRDKGFGPALGPEAAEAAIKQFERVGYRVSHRPADWTFGRSDQAIQLEVLAGWAAAVRETERIEAGALADWLAARQAGVQDGRSTMRIGHIDLYAYQSERK
jgi:SAM-dependent methyltransferase